MNLRSPLGVLTPLDLIVLAIIFVGLGLYFGAESGYIAGVTEGRKQDGCAHCEQACNTIYRCRP